MTSTALIAAGVTGAQAQIWNWNVDANGAWGTASNWNPASVPNSVSTLATATLGPLITADRTITLDLPINLGALNLQGANSYTLAPAPGANTLTFGFAGGFPTNLNSTATARQTIGSDVVLNTYLNADIGAGGDVTISGDTSGAGGITKKGVGALILSGTGAYTGSTAVNAGVLRAGAAGAFAPGSVIDVAAGATLDLNNFNQAVGSLSGAGTVTLGSANLTINGGNYKFSGQISGDGGSLTRAGSSNTTTWLTGTNTYTGGTTVNGGTLQVGDVSQGGSILGNAAINSGAALVLYCNTAGMGGSCNGSTGGSGTFSGTVANNGTLITQGGGTVTFSGPISGSGVLEPRQGWVVLTADNSYTGGTHATNGGKLQVGNGGTTGTMGTGEVSVFQLVFNRSNELIVDNLLSGTGTVTQAGAGKVILTANNTYTGGTAVNTGTTLQIGNGGESGALGSSSLIHNNGSLIFNRNNAYSVSQTITNDGVITNAGTGATTLNGVISGAGSVATTAGTLILNGKNTFSGGATIAPGSTLRAGVNGSGDNAALSTGAITNNGALVFDNGALYFGGAISGAGSVTQLSGKTYLTGESSYTGGTTISGGTLQVGYNNSGGSISGPVTIASGGGLLFYCNSSVSGGVCNGSTGGSGTFGGTIINNGTVATQGGGTLTLSGAITGDGKLVAEQGTTILTANNTYKGVTQNLSGVLQVGAGGETGSLGTGDVSFSNLVFNRSNELIVNNKLTGGGAVAQIGAGTTVFTANNSYTGWTSITDGALQLGNGGSSGSLGAGGVTASAGATLDINRSDTFTFANSVGGAGGLRQTGSGTTIITGGNTYTGGTAITAGALQIGNGGALGSIVGDVSTAANSTLAFNLSGQTFFSGAISGDGSVRQSGAGALILTGDNSYAGGTAIDPSRQLYVGAGSGQDPGATGSLGSGPVQNDGSLNLKRSGLLTIAGAITGTGSLAQEGGHVVLTGDSTYTGGTSISRGWDSVTHQWTGTMQLGDGGTTGSIVGDVTNDSTLSFNRSNMMVLNGAISGVGNVTQDGAGTTVLAGDNTYSGGTTISAGGLQLGNGGATGSITGDVTNNGALSFNRSNALTFGGVISGTGRVTQDGAGVTALTGANTYTGGTTISAGTLQIGNGGTTGSIAGDVTNNGALAFNRSNALTFGGLISGTGAVIQSGVGTTVLTKDNTYSGGTTITAGGLQIGAGGTTGALGSGPVTNAGALTFNRSNAYGFDGAIANSGVVTQAGAGATTLGGRISGAGAVTTTAGSLILAADNDYTGHTTIGSGSTVQLGNGGAAGTLGSGPVVDNGVLAINRSGTFEISGVISGTGRVDKMGPGSVILSANNTYTGGTSIAAGGLQLGAGGTTGAIVGDVATGADGMLSFNRSNTLTFDGLISGAGKVTQDGAGTTVLTKDNTYTGGTTITAGTLQLGDGSPYRDGSIVGDVTNYGVLSFNRWDYDLNLKGAILNYGVVNQIGSGRTILSGQISGSGSVSTTAGYLILTADNSYTGGTTIGAGSGLYLGDGYATGSILGDVTNNGELGFNRSDRLVFDGMISGSGGVGQYGSGTTVLTKDNTYTGSTNIDSGTLQLGNGGATGGIASTSEVNIWGDGYGNYATLSFNRSDRVVFDKFISGGGKVSQDGAGTTVLTADNYYEGGTTITAGTLQLGDGGATGSIQGDVDNRGTLSFNHSVEDSWSNYFFGTISGAGRVTQDGPGMTWLIGDNTYTGGTTITAGTLRLGWGGNTGSIVGDVVNNGALSFYRSDTLTFDGTISGTGRVLQDGDGTTVLTADNSYSGGTTISAGVLQIGNGGASGTLGTGPVVDNGVLAINRSGVFEIPGVISGTGRLYQMGPGTTILTGDNTYTGGTTISGGALQLGNGGTTGTVWGDVTNNSVLAFNRSNTLTFGGVISGTGTVTQDGPGITALTADNVYFGDTLITAGTLQLGDGGTSGAILNTTKVDTRSGGALSFNRSDNVVFDKFITGGGSARQDGVGKTTLTADNDYAGGTTIAAGTLQLGNGGTTGSILGDVVNNSALSFYRSDLLTFDGAISGTGRVTQDGEGTTVLTADNSYSGGTLISLGTLQIGNGGASGTLGTGPVVDNSVLAINRSGVFEIPGAISGTGRLDQMGPGTTILTGNNTYTGGTTISGGALQLGNGGTTGWIIGDVANDGTLIFNRSDAVTFDPTISGAGGVIQKGSGSTNLTATNTYTGPTLVQAGKLSINGSITSNTTVLPGATLGGNGTIFGSVMNYGTVAPGNSIGQLNIVGSYTQAANSYYQVEVNPAIQSDRIMVSGGPGTATINGGTVQVLPANGVYPLAYKYTILTATGGVTGKYAGLTTNLAFLRPMITYDANNVYLEAAIDTPTVDYSCGATTANQNAVATALDQADGAAAGDFANVIGALFGVNKNQGPAALEAMSGEPYSGFGTANVFGASLFGSGLRQQMALGRQGGAGGNRTVIRTADGKPSRLSSWASGIGGTRNVAGGASNGAGRVCGGWTPGRTAGQVFNAAGVMGGVDYRIDPALMVGLGGGWASGNNWTKGFNGRGESDSLTMATYASYTSGAAYADVLAGYAYNTNRMSRQIAIPGLPGERTARGTTGAPQWFGQAEFGYRFDLGQALMSSLTPFARLEATTISQRAFTEQGAAGLDLAVAGQRTSSLRSVLGTEFTTAYNLGWKWPLGLQARAGYAHDYANMTRPVTAGFAAVPWSRFTVQGAAPPRDSATVGLRLWALLDERYWPFLRYDGDIARGADSHAINAGLRITW